MAFEEGTQQFTCRDCGRSHTVKWSRMPVREWATVNCLCCPGVLFEGKSLHAHYDVRLD